MWSTPRSGPSASVGGEYGGSCVVVAPPPRRRCLGQWVCWSAALGALPPLPGCVVVAIWSSPMRGGVDSSAARLPGGSSVHLRPGRGPSTALWVVSALLEPAPELILPLQVRLRGCSPCLCRHGSFLLIWPLSVAQGWSRRRPFTTAWSVARGWRGSLR
jgi:hypothetical protein